MKRYFTSVFVLLGMVVATAQEGETKIGPDHASKHRSWAVDADLGILYLEGDLASRTANSFDLGFGAGIGVTKYISSVWGVGGHLTFGALNVQNSSGSLQSEIGYFDIGIHGSMNLSALSILGKKKPVRKWALLLKPSVGLGMPTVTKTDGNGNELVDVVNGSRIFQAYIGVGGELKRSLNNGLDLDFGVDVKGFIEDKTDGEIAGSSNDILIYPHVGITYHFPGKGNSKKDKRSVIYTSPLDDMYFAIDEIKNNYDKLTKDDDGDGVNNLFDKDNTTPEGVVVDGSGTPIDTDADGIPDYLDEDPFTTKGAKVDATGRAIDTDGDGVADYMDKEPNTPAGKLVNFKGETIKVSSGGGFASGYMPSVYFGFNSATVTAANHQRLAAIARVMKANSDLKVKVTGYSDKAGSEEYNKNLGMRRAKAVIKQLSQVYGIDESRMEAASEGENSPIAEGRNDVNRRVDVMPN